MTIAREWFYGSDQRIELSGNRKCLFFDPGFSLKKMICLLGSECSFGLHFCKQSKTWRELPFTTKERKPGCHRIDLNPIHAGCEWIEQENRIEKGFSRASTALLLSAVIGIYLNNGAPIAVNHWGPELVNPGDEKTRMALNITPKGCIFLYSWASCDPEKPEESPGVCVIKNPV